MLSLSRRDFALAFWGLVAVLIAINLGLRLTHTHWKVLGVLWFVPFALSIALIAGRLKSIGRNPWWAAAGIIPVVALAMGAALCLVPRRVVSSTPGLAP
jgi:uncharacterized membrane protein YhaH (DUF805 family)